MDPVYRLARNRDADLFRLQRPPQQTAPRHRCRGNRRYSAADREDIRSTTNEATLRSRISLGNRRAFAQLCVLVQSRAARARPFRCGWRSMLLEELFYRSVECERI